MGSRVSCSLGVEQLHYFAPPGTFGWRQETCQDHCAQLGSLCPVHRDGQRLEEGAHFSNWSTYGGHLSVVPQPAGVVFFFF